eukprot:624857-Pelagomonas_calceolata.AAC.2
MFSCAGWVCFRQRKGEGFLGILRRYQLSQHVRGDKERREGAGGVLLLAASTMRAVHARTIRAWSSRTSQQLSWGVASRTAT